MSMIKQLYVTSALLAICATFTTAGPAGRASITYLTATADAIIVGPVEVSLTGGTISATIVAERVLKGGISPAISIPLVWTNPSQAMPLPPGKAIPTSKGYGVFFLLRNANGSWSLLPTTTGDADWDQVYMHIPQNATQATRDLVSASLGANASELDKVLVEILVAVESGSPAPSEQLIAIFRENKSPVLTAAFTRFQSRPDVNFVCIGLRGSLVNGDSSVVPTMQHRYAELSLARTWPSLVDEIKRYYVNASLQTIQALGQIAVDTSMGADFRTAAAGALARMHTKESLPYLAKLLGDQNGALKSMAVGGFSMFANNVPIGSHEPAPGPWPYRTDDTIAHSGFAEVNVTFWQNWWQQNQSALTN